MILKFPIRIVSEANLMEHWTKKSKRNKAIEWEIREGFKNASLSEMLPCEVTLTRVAPRRLDDDNLRASGLKKVRDTIADLIIPGLRPGRADDDKKQISWVYDQRKGLPKEYALIVEVRKNG